MRFTKSPGNNHEAAATEAPDLRVTEVVNVALGGFGALGSKTHLVRLGIPETVGEVVTITSIDPTL